MDNTLGALVEQYKAEPSPKLRRMIWNSILSEELAEVLKNISITPESDWFVFDDTIQAKRIVDRKYLVVEVFVRGEAMLGFCYLINLGNYTESELQGFKKNCPDYAEADPGGEFHAAVAVAMACEVRDAQATFTAMSRDDIRVWIDRLESEIKV